MARRVLLHAACLALAMSASGCAQAVLIGVLAARSGGGSSSSDGGGASPSQGVPAAPSQLAATAVAATRVDLTWSDNATDETAFAVQRRVQGGGTFTTVGTLGANVTSFSDTTASPSTSYEYQVLATN